MPMLLPIKGRRSGHVYPVKWNRATPPTPADYARIMDGLRLQEPARVSARGVDPVCEAAYMGSEPCIVMNGTARVARSSTNWVSLRVDLSFSPTQLYQQVSLDLYQDDDNYVQMGAAYNSDDTDFRYERFTLDREVGGVTTTPAKALTGVWSRRASATCFSALAVLSMAVVSQMGMLV